MTLAISSELEQKLAARAQECNTGVDKIVEEALKWYLQIEPAFIDELEAWQEVRDEALGLIEEDAP
jgi:predicted transcriptional regulator